MALLAGITVLGAGCAGRNAREMEFRSTEPIAITEIRLTGDGGTVVVTTADRTDTQIDRVVRYSSVNAPETGYRIEGTALVIDTDCGSRCDVDYTVSAPRGVRVGGQSDAGDVRLTAVGAVNLRIESGSFTADGVDGPLRLQADSGDVTVSRVTGPADLRVQSGTLSASALGGAVTTVVESGDADLTLAVAVPVTARVDSGNLTLRVPDGKYRVRTDVDSGQVDVGIADDPAATTVLDLRADSGDLNVLRA
ncbi:hypothetical protein JCM9533A_38170 [Catenuloplanes niger JCM 9533]